MSEPDNTDAESTFEPRLPTLLATGICSLWIFILSLPMWTGKFLGAPASDQYKAGYGFRHWAAEHFKTYGEFPLWNPEIFGGLPFVGAMHGDIFYPTAWLRILLPTHTAMNLGFALHYVLAGLFAYLFFRSLKISWVGSVVGGVAYQLTGLVASYPNPGHDGKLFVTALFPLALLGLVLSMRQRRWKGYPILALAVGLGLLSPQSQMLYYMLVATGLFALYLTFGETADDPLQPRLLRLGGVLGAVIIGFGIGAIQIMPFFGYLPYSPRAEGITGGWERATSYAIPWEHVPEFFLSHFVGETTDGGGRTYWGSNGLKLHSEYLGLPVIALAIFGLAGTGNKRIKLWAGGIAALFLLVALGASTPFYRLWYSVMPFMQQVRAAGMALYIPAFFLAMFAAFGIDRFLRKDGLKHAQAWLIAGGAVALLALVGGFGGLATSLATGVQSQLSQYPAVEMAQSAAGTIRWGAVVSGLSLAAAGAIVWAALKAHIEIRIGALLLVALVGTDLWFNARVFWNYTDAPDTLFGGDAITELLADIAPNRVLNLQVYPPTNISGSVLMAYNIPELLGHHGNEMNAFDQLMGGQDAWTNLPFYGGSSLHLLDLYAVSHLIIPAGRLDSVPGYQRVLTNVQTAGGLPADLFERDLPVRYARIVAAGLKILDQAQVVATVADPRFPIDRVVVLDSTAVDIEPPGLSGIPDSVEASVSVTEWAPGRMRLEISPAAPQNAFVVISENWYFDWQATVDGQPVTPIRGNGALLTVPVAAGARKIELRFESDAYRTGKGITLASLLLVAVGFMMPVALRRKKRV